MINGQYGKHLLAVFTAAFYLTGCTASEQPLSESAQAVTAEVQATETDVTEASSEEAVMDVDRYAEIIDCSGDNGKLTAVFLDLEVGPDAKDKSGDSAILISPDGKVMLLDAGHPDCGDIVVQTLKDMGIEKIDYLVTSHPHIDHIGGVPAVMKEFPVEAAYRSYVEYTTQTYDEYVNALKENETEIVYLKTGDTFSFGDQVSVEVLGPEEDIQYPEDFPDNSTQFLNNNSLVLKFTFGESTALFAGDLYVTQERDYIDQYGEKLQADVIKANHHGKDTSNSNKWIKTLAPKIMVAMGDEMGSMDVYQNVQKIGAEYHHTLHDGFVKVRMDDKKHYEVLDQKDSWLN